MIWHIKAKSHESRGASERRFKGVRQLTDSSGRKELATCSRGCKELQQWSQRVIACANGWWMMVQRQSFCQLELYHRMQKALQMLQISTNNYKTL